MSVDPTRLKEHYDVLRGNYKVVITHTGGTAMGRVTSLTAAGVKVDNGALIPYATITSLQATPG